MENNEKVQLRVGIFLAVGLILLLGSIFMLGADKAFFRSYTTLHAHFDQVQGLAEGSVVSFSGITVGNIKKIQILPERNQIDIVMQIDNQFMPRVTEGSMVEIRTQGALGDKYIFIIPGDPKAKPLTENAVIEVAKATDILGILSERGNEAEKIFDIINEMHRFSKSLNAENRVDKILANMASATAKIDKTATATEKIAEGFSDGKIKDTIDRLDSVMTKLDRGQGTLGALINDPTVHDQIKTMLGGSSRKNYMKNLLRTSIEKNEEK
jgi:phospholipid/cholesterol/gamma-HCH transport system substrate-binding protein